MKSKLLQSQVVRFVGCNYVCANGHTVQPNLMSAQANIGDTISYAAMASLKTVRMGGHNTQWTEQRNLGVVIYKQL